LNELLLKIPGVNETQANKFDTKLVGWNIKLMKSPTLSTISQTSYIIQNVKIIEFSVRILNNKLYDFINIKH